MENLVPEEELQKITYFKTAKGSIYNIDKEGKTTRYKTATKEQNERQDLTVFVNLRAQELQDVARTAQDVKSPEKVYVLERQPDDSPKIVRDVSDIQNRDNIYLAILDTKKDKWLLMKKVSLIPEIGKLVFDFRTFQKDGETFTERHLGNKVIEIG